MVMGVGVLFAAVSLSLFGLTGQLDMDFELQLRLWFLSCSFCVALRSIVRGLRAATEVSLTPALAACAFALGSLAQARSLPQADSPQRHDSP